MDPELRQRIVSALADRRGVSAAAISRRLCLCGVTGIGLKRQPFVYLKRHRPHLCRPLHAAAPPSEPLSPPAGLQGGGRANCACRIRFPCTRRVASARGRPSPGPPGRASQHECRGRPWELPRAERGKSLHRTTPHRVGGAGHAWRSIKLANLPHEQEALLCELDAMTSSNDENHRIRPRRKLTLAAGSQTHEQNLEPYDVHFWYLHGRSWDIGQ